MIQRIQTVYLLIVAIALSATLLLPVGSFYTSSTVYEITNLLVYGAGRIISAYTTVPLLGILVIGDILSLVAIFLYRKRSMQIRLSKMVLAAIVLYYAVAAYLIGSVLSGYGKFVPSWGICLPLISIIPCWLAICAIKRDEKLVRSYDRIR